MKICRTTQFCKYKEGGSVVFQHLQSGCSYYLAKQISVIGNDFFDTLTNGKVQSFRKIWIKI